MKESPQEIAYEANVRLHQTGLVVLTWGNVSVLDRESGLMFIKPSGIPVKALTPNKMAIVSLKDGTPLPGSLRPSSDTKTHLALYRAFPELAGIVHTHSTYATAWAQSGRDLPCFGTTHADHFNGTIPCARALTPDETADDYEANTGTVILEAFQSHNLDPLSVPGVLCRHHGPFTWGQTAKEAVDNAIALETIAKLAFLTLSLNPATPQIPAHILEKHHARKHGPNAYYGQA